MEPNFYDLRYFLEVAQTKNLSRAAERIGITQPTLTQACKRLEAAAGAQLLIRSKKGVELTAAGHRLRTQFQLLIDQWEGIRRIAKSTTSEVTGVVRLGCHVSVALYSVAHFLPALFKKHQNLEVVLEHDLSRHIVDRVIHYKLEMGVVVNPTPHPDLVIHKLTSDTVTVWESSDSALAANASSTLIYDPNLLQVQDILTKLRKQKTNAADEVPLRTIQTTSLELATQLAVAGTGRAILPSRVVGEHAKNKLKVIKGLPTFSDQISLVYRHENKSLKNIEAFVQEIKKVF